MVAMKMLVSMAIAALVAAAPAAAREGTPAQDPGFEPRTAFCERETFALAGLAEVPAWLDYVAGLRTARTTPPELDCPSATLRALVEVLASENEATALERRSTFFASFVDRAMEPEAAASDRDDDGSFRYLNDVALASFVWLLCSIGGQGQERGECAAATVEAFPADYLRTSPVFCDFAREGGHEIEWPASGSRLPLACASGSGPGDAGEWLSLMEYEIRE